MAEIQVSNNDPLTAFMYSLLGSINAGDLSKLVIAANRSAGQNVRYPDEELYELAKRWGESIVAKEEMDGDTGQGRSGGENAGVVVQEDTPE